MASLIVAKLRFTSENEQSPLSSTTHRPITLEPGHVDRIRRGECSAPNEIIPELVHVGLAHSIRVDRELCPADVYIRELVYASDEQPRFDQLNGPTKRLDGGRMRVIVVWTDPTMMCTCVGKWCAFCRTTTESNGVIPHPIHILYDDFNACLVTDNAQALYITKWDLTPGRDALVLPLPPQGSSPLSWPVSPPYPRQNPLIPQPPAPKGRKRRMETGTGQRKTKKKNAASGGQ